MDRDFYPARDRLAEDPVLGFPSTLRFHDLRHTCATILYDQGWNAKQIQERLGHASIRTTLDTYGHLWPDSDIRTREAVDEELGSVEPTASLDADLAGR